LIHFYKRISSSYLWQKLTKVQVTRASPNHPLHYFSPRYAMLDGKWDVARSK